MFNACTREKKSMPLARRLTWRVKDAFFQLEHGGGFRISASVLQMDAIDQPIIPTKWVSFRIEQSRDLLLWMKTCS